MLILENGTVKSHRASAGGLHELGTVRNRHRVRVTLHDAYTARGHNEVAVRSHGHCKHSDGPDRAEDRINVGGLAAFKISMESLLLDQDERWRRA